MTPEANRTRPKSLKNHKWEAVIDEFIINGRNAAKAYKKAYPNCETEFQAASRLFKNVKFNAMLDEKLEQIAKKHDIKVGLLEAMYQKAYDQALIQEQTSAAVSATTGIARLYGMDKQAVITEHVPDQPVGKEAEALEQASKEYKLRLAGTGS